MEVLVVADGHYYRDSNGNVYVESVFDYNFYRRYLTEFEKVTAIGRVENVAELPKGVKIASGENVSFIDFPAYRGPWQYLKLRSKLRGIARKYVNKYECGIFRVPGATANIICKEFAKTGKPFALEVVVDPWEYFAKGTIKSLARPFVRIQWTRFIKKYALKADGVSYVTEAYLQQRYPCKALNKKSDNYFTAAYSSVELPDNSFAEPRQYSHKEKIIISHVANSFTSYGKGHITLMRALKIVNNRGYDVDVIFVGDGPLKNEFIQIAQEMGISAHVNFIGRLPNGDAVRSIIKSSDIFVFPTQAEGLPRVVLEAMAEGIPVISSPVCGIPEILPADCLVDYGDYKKYAQKIIDLIESPIKMTELSKHNLAVAKNYSYSRLTKKRNVFYRELRKLAENQ